MIVYGSPRAAAIDIPTFVRRFVVRLSHLPSIPPLGALVDAFADFGEVHSAVADAAGDDPERAIPAAWRDTSDALADAVCRAWAGDRTLAGEAAARAGASAHRIALGAPRSPVRVKPAEGFAQYGLYPEQYAAAAGRLVRVLAPKRLACVGIRSIGLPLAHIVAASARMCGSTALVASVRPGGHPFDRRTSLPPPLRAELAAFEPDVLAVVDEGPGLSGSSFGSVVDTLADNGFDRHRIVLLPSWDAAATSLRSLRAQCVWRAQRRFVVTLEDAAPDLLHRHAGARVAELSAGAWRTRLLPEPDWPAVHPQHERRKLLVDDVAGRRQAVLRFAGLGRHGRAALERAERLHDAGFGVRPLGIDRGFLQLEWADGAPLTGRSPHESVLVDRVASYLAFVKRSLGTAVGDDLVELRHMIAINSGVDHQPRFAAAERCAIDGRMLRHEWVASAAGIVKTDALDHHADDFFPGCRDIAWDLAAAMIELRFTRAARQRLVERYVASAGDRSIVDRLAFYRAAYLAWRIGYATLAAETLGESPDGERFRADLRRYRRLSAGHAGIRTPVPRR